MAPDKKKQPHAKRPAKPAGFYQSKYDYYKNFTRGILIIATCAYLAFFITDCQLFGRFSWETLLPRLIILLPLTGYLIAFQKIKSYKIMVFLSYLMIHFIIWGTDWATYLLPDRSYASEGMIVMNLIFVCCGFCAPFWFSSLAHALMIVDILVANLFIHYDALDMMIMFNVPCVIGLSATHWNMEQVYLDHYLVSQRLKKLVIHDQLTGVYNRNKLKELVTPEGGCLTLPEDAGICILLIDIDFFKKVNDRYGHEAGDTVLVSIASILKQTVRCSDYVIRWGGEEFLIIVPGCSAECGMTVAEKLRKNVEESDNGICPVTISIGITSYDGGNYHDAIAQADKALYQAKHQGRNQIVKYVEE